MIAQELEVSLHMAFMEARQKRHEFITVEHLLLALLDNPSASEVLKACAAEIGVRADAADFGETVGAHPLAGPYRPPAVHLIKGANVRLLGFGQTQNLIVETVVEGGGRRRALDGNLLRPRSGGEGDRRRCDAQTQFPSIHNPSASRWPDPREPTPLFLLI